MPDDRIGRFPQYQEFADDFAVLAESNAYNAEYDRPAVLALLGDVRSRLVLDAACGPGLYAEELIRRGARVVGFDQSSRMIELAAARNPTAALRVHDLADPLDWLPTATVDMAVLALAIHHLDDRLAALRELHRVLTPAGLLVVSTGHPTADWLRHGGRYFDTELIIDTWSEGWRISYWRQPLSEMCTEFFAAGFVIDDLVEPRPTAEMARRHPEDYRTLVNQPAFIAFRLTKRR